MAGKHHALHPEARSAGSVPEGAPAGPGATAPRRHWTLEWLRSILVAVGLFLIIRTFLVEAFRIPSSSMEDTLLVGDFLIVNKAIYGGRIPLTDVRMPAFAVPAVGRVAVFVPPHDPGRNYVKRIVAAAGDTVAMRDGQLLLNGEPVAEAYVRHTDSPDTYDPAMGWQCAHRPDGPAVGDCRPTRDNWGPLLVPEAHYLLLGDNRHDSEDSRYWGFVPRDAIKGTPLFVYFSFDPATPRPFPALTGIRWERIGETVH